jgi:dienelactone hydrolase
MARSAFTFTGLQLRGIGLALAALVLAACGGTSSPDAPATTDDNATAAAAADPALPGAPVTTDGLVGRWFAPTSPGPQPALLVLGGSEGGLGTVSRMGAGLHAEGYAVFALGYFGVEGLPDQLQEIPLEYFVRALDWLTAQPGVDPARIGVVGGSKGAEAALLLASRDARVRAVVAATPTDHAWQSVDWNGWSDTPSWTAGGQPVAYLRYAPFDMAAGLRAMYDRSVAEATPEAREAARIPLERSQAALLLIAGEADGLWGAAEAAQRIADRLAAAKHPYPVQVLRYPDAGHVVFIARTLAVDDPLLARFEGMGGTAEGTRAAINDAWPKSLQFLRERLAVAVPTR